VGRITPAILDLAAVSRMTRPFFVLPTTASHWIGAIKMNQKLSVLASLGLALALPRTAIAQREKPSAGALNELGAEGKILAQRTGLWDVTETVWA
jgi:hypothetical protein